MANEKENLVYLAGPLRSDPARYEQQVTALIDVGLGPGIRVTIYTGKGQNQALAAELMKYRRGDYIGARCMIKPWQTKQADGAMKYGMSIDVLEIAKPEPTPEPSKPGREPGEEPPEEPPPGLKSQFKEGTPLKRYSADSPPPNWKERDSSKVLK